jgi:hypothetical protein
VFGLDLSYDIAQKEADGFVQTDDLDIEGIDICLDFGKAGFEVPEPGLFASRGEEQAVEAGRGACNPVLQAEPLPFTIQPVNADLGHRQDNLAAASNKCSTVWFVIFREPRRLATEESSEALSW